MKKRKVHELTSKGKELGVMDRRPSGFGYVIIPSDISRDNYLKDVYLKGRCMIITQQHNEIIREVAISKGIIEEIVFPTKPDDRGSLIGWINESVTNQVRIESIFNKPDESIFYRENTYTDLRTGPRGEMNSIKSLDSMIWQMILVNEDGNDGSIVIGSNSPKNKSFVKFKCDGSIEVEADIGVGMTIGKKLTVKWGLGEEQTVLTVHKDDGLKYIDRYKNEIHVVEGSVKVVSENVVVESNKIQLGDGETTEKGVLGDELKKQISLNKALLDAIKSAIASSPVGTSDGGLVFKNALTSSLSSITSGNFENILSENVTLK